MIYLASLSPRRAELLDQIKINYQKIAVNVDETPHPHEKPQDYVTRLALAKASAGRLALSTTKPVLGADTTVVCNKQIFGKPLDENDAKQMLRQLSGGSHKVMTAVALVTTTQEKLRLNINKVYFRQLTEAEIRAYVATGEPMDKAGGYAIQGLASVFIRRIKGSYSGVMGLPLYDTARLLNEIGVDIF